MSYNSRYCKFCHRPVVKGQSAVGIPSHITSQQLKIWKSCAGLRDDEDFGASIRVHSSHFEPKYLSTTAECRARLLPGAIPTINVYGCAVPPIIIKPDQQKIVKIASKRPPQQQLHFSFCRFCMSSAEFPQKDIPIEFYKTVELLTGQTMVKRHDFPNKICNQCYDKFDTFKKFSQSIIQIQKNIEQTLQTPAAAESDDLKDDEPEIRIVNEAEDTSSDPLQHEDSSDVKSEPMDTYEDYKIEHIKIPPVSVIGSPERLPEPADDDLDEECESCKDIKTPPDQNFQCDACGKFFKAKTKVPLVDPLHSGTNKRPPADETTEIVNVLDKVRNLKNIKLSKASTAKSSKS